MAETGGGDAPMIPALILIAGGYIAWFAVHYWRDTVQVYPSGPVKAVLTGGSVPAPVREGSAQDPNAQAFAPLPDFLQSEASEPGGGLGLASGGASGGAGAGGAAGAVGTAGATGTAGAGGNFSTSRMIAFWTQNGGDPARAQFAAGVVNAESGGDPNATSSNPDGGTNVGLFQLDTKGVGAGHSVEELKDPTLNTTITIMATRNGTDWADWADPFITEHGTSGNM